MAKYTIDLDTFSIRLLNGDGRDLPHDMKSAIMNLVTAVACGDLMVVQCTEADRDVPVFLLCAFLSGKKYKSLSSSGDRLIPLCELTHPNDLLECIRPPADIPAAAFVVPMSDTEALNAFANSTYSPLLDGESETASEDHSKQTKH